MEQNVFWIYLSLSVVKRQVLCFEALNLWIIKQDDPAQYRNWIYNESGLPEFENSDFEISEYDLSAYEELLYPNPTDGIVRIEGIDEAEVTAYNILGQKVKTEIERSETCGYVTRDFGTIQGSVSFFHPFP